MTTGDLLRPLGLVAALLAVLPAFARVLADDGWRAPALGAAAVVLGVSLVAHLLRRGPLFGMVLAGLAGALAVPWLVGVTERPWFPDEAARATLAALWQQGLDELAVTPAPAPSLPGLVLLTTVAFATVAWFAAAFVRHGRGELALVPITLLWIVPLAIPAPSGDTLPVVVPFLVVAVAYLLVTAQRGGDELPQALPIGVGLGAIAIVVALVAPGLLPGYGAPAWVALGQGGEPRGYQPIVDISERLQLPEEREVLRVAATQRSYLRLAGLDHFDGSTWRLGEAGTGSYRPDPTVLYPATDPLPPEVPAARTEPVFVDVEVLELENFYVPTPYQPVEVVGPTRDEMVWSTDGGFLATVDTTTLGTAGSPRIGVRPGVTYRVSAERPAPRFDELYEGELAGASLDPTTLTRLTDLPSDYPALRAQAEEIYEAAGATTDIERALALQAWFVGRGGGFTYDLDVAPLRGEDALERFVLEDKVGYCEYFATAMAVMLRATGVPARVAVGFLPGEITLEADPAAGRELTEFTVSTSDAHAWVEVRFPEHGWVTFEPTPRDDQTQIVPRTEDLAPTENERERRQRELEEAVAELGDDRRVPDAAELPDEGAAQTPAAPDEQVVPAGEAGETRSLPLVIALVVVGALAIAILAVSRRRVPTATADVRDALVASQRQLLDTAAGLGLGRADHETVEEVVARWSREGRVDEGARELVPVLQAAAFGGEVTGTDAATVTASVAEVERQLESSVDRRARALAPVRGRVARLRHRARDAARHVRSRVDARRGRDTSP